MSWIALVLTLLLEQARALPAHNAVYAAITRWSDRVSAQCNAGRPRHGVYGWLMVAGLGALIALTLFESLRAINWLLALVLDVAVLYFSLGFRQFSHPITQVQAALQSGNADEARRVFLQWRRSIDPGFEADDLSESEIARLCIEWGTLSAHRHVFGVFFWFLMLPGPSGAVLYRLSEYLCRHWGEDRVARQAGMEPDHFGQFAQQAFAVIDWLPVRLSAIGFAIVGDFEGALHCWRNLAIESRPSVAQDRLVLLAAAGGAIGVRVLSSVDSAKYLDVTIQESVGLTEPTPDSVRSGVGLAWRAMVLWLVLLLMLSISHVVA
jgi:adenosylcobinamide-phosphate synthase